MPRKFGRGNKRGSLQGLPLFLIVLVIVAAVGIAILIGWMYMVKKPELDHITIDNTDLTVGNTVTVTVTAYDVNGKVLEGVEIHLEGCGIDQKKLTDKNGRAQFDVTPTLPMNVHTREIKVTAQYTGTTTKVVQAIITVHDYIISRFCHILDISTYP
ncbi:MAG: hypothetical protein ACP5LE_00405 [Thermoplasmata archaeon]